MIGTRQDITEKKQADEQLSYLARYDHLTGLTNRLLFKDRLGQLVALANRRKENIAVL